jgi:hypothetical protein
MLSREVKMRRMPILIAGLTALFASSALAGAVSAFETNGVQLGAQDWNTSDCRSSDTWANALWCHHMEPYRNSLGGAAELGKTRILVNGTVYYVNLSETNAAWAVGEIGRYMDALDRTGVGRGVRTFIKIPGGDAVMAVWGNLQLEDITMEERSSWALAESPRTGNITVDFIGNITKSARTGLPIYRVVSGVGSIWTADNAGGHGNMRNFSVNADYLNQLAVDQPRALAYEHEPDNRTIWRETPGRRADSARQEREEARKAELERKREADAQVSQDREDARKRDQAELERKREADAKAAEDARKRDEDGARKREEDAKAHENLMAHIAEAQARGPEYVKQAATTWDLEEKTNPMTDGLEYVVTSRQDVDPMTVSVVGKCSAGNIVLTAMFNDKRPGRFPVVAPEVTTRINRMPTYTETLKTPVFTNQYELVRISAKAATDEILLTTWALRYEFQTNVGPIVVQIPMFDIKVQKFVGSCKSL